MATQIVMNRNGDPRHNLRCERREGSAKGRAPLQSTDGRWLHGSNAHRWWRARRDSHVRSDGRADPVFSAARWWLRLGSCSWRCFMLQTISSGGSSRPAHAGREPFAIGSSPKYSRAPRPQTLEGMVVVRAAGAVRCAQLFRGHRLPHRKAIPDEPRRRSERLRAGRRWPAASGLVLRT